MISIRRKYIDMEMMIILLLSKGILVAIKITLMALLINMLVRHCLAKKWD